MAKANGKPRERTSSVTELADFAGVSRNTIYEWMKLPGFPIAPDRSVCKWEMCEWCVNKSVSGETGIDGEDFESADSPGLERYRLARAGQEEIKLAEMRKEFLRRDWVHQKLADLAGILKGAAEQLQRGFGEDAREILDSAVVKFEKQIDQEWQSQS